MIVDTSALIAILREEDGHESMKNALRLEAEIAIPAPVFIEFHRVTYNKDPNAAGFIAEFLADDISVLPFGKDAAQEAASANPVYGKGNHRGGKLNLLDLMVYGAAKAAGYPILCTGRDFASTDAEIHPASRID